MGLVLNMGAGAHGSYTPMTPGSTGIPSTTASVAQQAYGISGTGAAVGPATAGLGSTAVGVLSIGLLIFIWYSLPR